MIIDVRLTACSIEVKANLHITSIVLDPLGTPYTEKRRGRSYLLSCRLRR
jgi:hypothetical protein